MLATLLGSGLLAEYLSCQMLVLGRLLHLSFQSCDFALKEQEYFTPTKTAAIF